jgi:hypothetical protein
MNFFVKFNYLYRDAGNYKSWGEVIFSNPDGLNLGEIDRQLKLRFDQEILFVAHQINIPEVFLYAEQNLNADDHCFHEYDSVEIIKMINSEIDKRSITQFIKQVEFASISGWEAFNPMDKITEIREYSNSDIK